MKPLKLFPATVVFSLFALHPLAAFDKIPVAIMDFKVTNVDKNEFDLFLDFLSNALFETGVFDVLQRDKRDKLLQEIQFSMSDTADAKKTRQVGKLLSSKLLVFGNLGKVGKNVLLSVSLVDVETGRTVSTFSKTYKSLEEVFESLPVVSASLADTAAQSMFMKMTSVLYFDDFEQETWIVSDKLFYKDGQYNILSADQDWYTWQNQIVDDFSIECQARHVSGDKNSGAGVIFRLQDENNFYAFFVSPSGFYKVVRYAGGQYIDLIPWTASKAINENSPNRLKVTAFRSRFSFFVNNVRVKEFSDDKFREGKFGLFAFKGFQAAFDDLIVYQGNLVAYDYFSKPSTNFAEDEVAYTVAGEYHLDGKTKNVSYYSWMGDSRKNISFSALTQWRAGDSDQGYGIAFRLTDANNNYTFHVTKSGFYRVGFFKNGQWTVLVDWKKSNFLNSDGRNMLRVDCTGADFSLYVNENLVESVNDATFAQGKVGVCVNQGVDVAFDNVELFALE